ncbi:hypothetical protein BHE74_00052700, partial [Ensete ventricosum]
FRNRFPFLFLLPRFHLRVSHLASKTAFFTHKEGGGGSHGVGAAIWNLFASLLVRSCDRVYIELEFGYLSIVAGGGGGGGIWMAAEYHCCEANFFIHILIIALLVLFAGLMSGLTLGLMSLSLVDLEVLAKSGTPQDSKHAGTLCFC